MFEPLYNRVKLEKRLDSLLKAAQQDVVNAFGKIKEHVTAKLEALSRSFRYSKRLPLLGLVLCH